MLIRHALWDMNHLSKLSVFCSVCDEKEFLTSSLFLWCNPNIALIEQIETNCCLIEIHVVTRALTVGTCSNIQYDLVYYMVDFVD